MGPVSIAIEGDKELGLTYLPEARQLLFKLRAQMEPGGIMTSRAYMDLPDGAYAYAISAMGVEAIRIVVGPGPSPNVEYVPVPSEPDFVSGVMVRGKLSIAGSKRVASSFIPTNSCAALHKLTPGGGAPSARLAVSLGGIPPGDQAGVGVTPELYAQVASIKPTLYSGKMKSLVQILMGFGKQGKTSIYDDKPKRVQPADSETRPSYYEQQVAQSGLQIQYDYRFYKTNGLVKAVDGVWWLVEISAGRGILATRLQLHAATLTAAFRAKLARLGDEDGEVVIDEFRGYPTGETLPGSSGDLASAIRAGIVLQLAKPEELQGFYGCRAYSSSMGWAFSDSGREAHNTAWKFGPDGVQRGVHYSVGFNIGAVNVVELGKATVALLWNMLGKTTGVAPARIDILRQKAKRISAEQAREVLSTFNSGGANAGASALDQIELPPEVNATAKLSLVSEGNIWWPVVHGPQIKFPEPLLGYLLSHDMRPAYGGVEPKCDTTMHVFFKGEELRTCKYFHAPRQTVPDIDIGDDDPCRYVGTWVTKRETLRSIPSMFYTSDFDDREELGGSLFEETIKGVDLGYTMVAARDNLSAPQYGEAIRIKTFKHSSLLHIRNGVTRKGAIAVPFQNREAYYYAVRDYADIDQVTTGTRYEQLQDPWSYQTWRNFCGFTGSCLGQGCCERAAQGLAIWSLADHPSGCGKVTARTVMDQVYTPTPCSDYADSGPWAAVCDDIDRMTYALNHPPGTFATKTERSTEFVRVHLCSSSGKTPFMTKSVKSTDEQITGFEFWFLPSPDPQTGLTAYIATSHNAMGDGDALKYMTNINGLDNPVIGQPRYAVMEAENITFIGVINGV